MSPSYQLPDLLNLSRPFEFQTNPSCRPVTLASESWLLALKGPELDGVLTPTESSALSSKKAGLLAAVCFPTCDLPQLRFLADFLTLLIISHERMRRESALTNSGWSEGEHDWHQKSGVDCLCDHELFQYIVPQMKRLVLRAQVNWDKRFTLSVRSYRSAHLQVISNRSNNIIPELEEYMKLRRDMCGINMVFDLVELTEIAAFTVSDADLAEKLQTLKQLAADIIACSLDVVSFNVDQALDNKHNLITVLVTHKALTIQGAFTFAGALIKDMIDAFSATERSLLNLNLPTSLQPSQSYLATLFSHPWIWTPFARAPSSPPITEEVTQAPVTTLHGLHSCVQTLKNCIAGTINWAYETELYFGKKGDEIRAFGWVFLSPKTP